MHKRILVYACSVLISGSMAISFAVRCTGHHELSPKTLHQGRSAHERLYCTMCVSSFRFPHFPTHPPPKKK
ncbi:hypothetical protein BX666DRAFT_610822 [Dichotomocladium elegans]|nr:hypothetical protein BX666DRAFT_610822 [Dichotomocladium elegans]